MGGTPTPATPVPAAPAAPGQAQEPTHPSYGLAFEAEHGLTGNRLIQFATRNLPPPAELYVVADDGLLITVTTSQPGLTVLVSAQLLLPDGRLSSNQFQVNPPGTSTATASWFQLTEGYLFNVTVQPMAGLRRGACWVTVAIRRGGVNSGVTLQTLIQDYVDAYSGPTWPGGIIRSSTDGSGLLVSVYTAAVPLGQSWTFTVPANTRIRMRSLSAYFVASAAAATRGLTLVISDASGNQLFNDAFEASITASGSAFLCWATGVGWAQTALVRGGAQRSAPDLTLSPGMTVQLFVAGIQSGDQLQNVNFSYEQWFSV